MTVKRHWNCMHTFSCFGLFGSRVILIGAGLSEFLGSATMVRHLDSEEVCSSGVTLGSRQDEVQHDPLPQQVQATRPQEDPRMDASRQATG